MNMTDTCHQCENEYEKITMHWQQSNCDYQPLTKRQHQVITGLVLGDASATLPHNCRYPCVMTMMSTRTYLLHLSNKIFPVLSGGVSVGRTPQEGARAARQSGFRPDADAGNYSTMYQFRLFSHPGIEKYRNWYSTGKKVFPSDLELTPTSLKHYFVGDGTFDETDHSVSICISNERDNRGKIVNMFERAGFTDFEWYRISRKEWKDEAGVRFRKEGTENFFDYVGDPPPGFAYKWPEDRR